MNFEMNPLNENKVDKKEIIKLLTLRNEPGTETLYRKIPFFMRTRMEGLIDQIDWMRIKQGCDHENLDCSKEAFAAYYDLLKKIDEYLTLYPRTKKEAKTDDMMLMRTDLNFIKAEYGTDVVKFVKAMAECIQKEDELIENYGRKLWAIESAAFFYENLGIDMVPSTHSPVHDLTVVEPVPDPIPEEIINIGATIAVLKEYLSHFQNETHLQALIDISNSRSGALMSEDNSGDSSDQTLDDIFKLFQDLYEMMNTYVETLESKVSEWRTARAKASVSVGPKTDDKKMEKSFSDFSEHLKELLSLFHNEDLISKLRQTRTNDLALYQNYFEAVKTSLFHCNLVVYTEPKDLMSIENVGNRKSNDDKAAPSAGAKTKRKYRTKKKNSFNTEVRLLGGRHFRIQFEKSTIELVAEKDLAEGETGNADQSSQLVYTTKVDAVEAPDSVVFENVDIKSFCRVEQNHIYKQFFRLRYNLVCTVEDSSYNLSILSQPFMFNTGSNQILELIAARMWYCFKFDLYKGNFICEDTLDVNDVLDMLDARVANLHPNGSRSLFPEEREFLRSRLPNSSSGRITMQGFIKDKMKKTRKSDEDLSFPFHTWFYAVMNSIQTHLLKPWVDGVIYGFCSESQARDILECQKDVGTFIIRPSISREINAMSSRDASADLTIDIKMRNDNPGPSGQETYIQSIPLLLSSVNKYSLYGAIAGIRKDNQPIAKYCLTNKKEKKNIAHLEVYTREKTKDEITKETIKDYGIITQQVEQMVIKRDSSGEAKFEDGPQRKRPFPIQISQDVPPAPLVNLPPMIDMDFQNILGDCNFDTDASGQGHRSGHQSNCLPVHIEVEPGNILGVQEPESSILRLDRGIEGDMSNLIRPSQEQIEWLALVLQQAAKQNTEEANNFLNCADDSNVLQYDPQPDDLFEFSPSNSGISSFHTLQTVTAGNHHTLARSTSNRTQYKRFNSNPPSNVSTSTTISQDDMSWNSPSDSGIDRDHTPSPPNEETIQKYSMQGSNIDLDSGNY